MYRLEFSVPVLPFKQEKNTDFAVTQLVDDPVATDTQGPVRVPRELLPKWRVLFELAYLRQDSVAYTPVADAVERSLEAIRDADSGHNSPQGGVALTERSDGRERSASGFLGVT